MRKIWPGLLLNLAAAVFGFAVWSRLPARVASHWDMNGNVNGTMPRTMFVLFVPLLALVVAVVMVWAPRLDPKRANFPLHSGAYWIVVNAILALQAIIQIFALGHGLGWKIPIDQVVGVGVALLFVVLGNVLTRVRPNWIFGVRTPWTLSSDLSWRETHRLAGYGFVLDGIAVLVTAFVYPHALFHVLLGGMLVVALVSIVWSYLAWKRDPNAQGRSV
jgi:uncharacterized membrane protein